MKRLRLIFAACLAMASGAAFAQNVVYTQGNAKIVQLTDGWQILCGESVVAHGDGTLDVDNLPPAFSDFLDIYAQQEEPVADAAKSDDEPVYGPLLRTQWNQYAPYNNLFPIIDGEGHALTGCAQTATAQILNYYKYCKPFNRSGTCYTSSSSIESPYISNITKITKEEGGAFDGELQYDYNFSYTPDFEKINTDNEHLAKFFLGIAFEQGAYFVGLSATLGYNESIYSWIKYGYNWVSFGVNEYGESIDRPYIEDLTTNDYIATAIKKGLPVNIKGDENGVGHTFIIDGCHGNEFHTNYGWGGSYDGWFTIPTRYHDYMRIFAAHPADTNAAFMQAEPKYLNIKGENGFSKRVEMEQSEDNKLEYKQKGNLNLDAGVYEFCFEYADGSTIAPYTDSVIKLGERFEKWGRFVTTPAKIAISNSYNVDFWIKQNKAEIDVVCVDYRVTVSGRVTDNHSEPIEGARVTTATTDPASFADFVTTDFVTTDADGRYTIGIERYSTTNLLVYHYDYTFSQQQSLQNVDTELADVDFVGLSKKVTVSGRVVGKDSKTIEGAYVTTAEAVPVLESEQKNDSTSKYTYMRASSGWYTTEFVATQPYLSKFEIRIYKYSPDSSLTVGIFDETKNVLWQKKLNDDEIASSSSVWTAVEFDNGFLHLEPGHKYYIALKTTSTKNISYAYIGESRDKMTYRMWWCNADYVVTDANGNYSFKVDRYFTGTLSAYHDDYFCCQQSLQNVDTELTGVDFECLSKKVTVSGRVTGKDSKPIEGAYVTVAGVVPDSVMTDENGNYSIEVDRYFTGTLSVNHYDYIFSQQSLQNVDNELSGVNFECLTKKVTVSGRVTGKDSKPIEGAYVTTAEAVPVLECEQKNDSTAKYTYMRSSSGWYTTEFVAAQPYMSKFEIKTYKYDPDSSFSVGILDETKKVLWQKKLNDDEIAGRGWTAMEFDNGFLHLEPGQKYYIALKTTSTKTYSYAYIGESSDKMTYRIWWSNADFAMTDENGYYNLKVDRYFTGSLHAYSDSHEFNAISFTNLPDDATDKDFVEDGSNVEVEYKLDSITVVAPLKTNYKVGETFDKAGMTVYACYSDGSKVAVTDYEMSAIDLSSAGRKTVTVTYNGKTAQFGLTVGLNVHSIIYVVDNERYRTISDVEPGTALTPIAEPTKEGYTFSGWSQMPATMPDADVTVKGTFTAIQYSLDSITVVAPIKTNYKVGETFDKAGMTVYACYSDGSKVAVTDYEMSTIELSSAGRKTVTVTYNGKTAQFGLTVGLNVHSIIYVVDNERYRTISDVEPGTALTPIAAPTKEGYTFSGWSQMPATMPDADVTVTGTFTKNEETTSAEQYAAEQLKIWAAGRTIVVDNANDEICVYDAMGRLVCRDAERLATARLRVNATGLYIVRVGSVAKRMFVE